MQMRRTFASLVVTGVLAGGALVGLSGPAGSQVVANNLVGLNISGNQVTVADVADVGANVAVPIGVAANVCGVSVAVLADLLPGPTQCDADTSAATGDQSVRQNQALAFVQRNGIPL